RLRALVEVDGELLQQRERHDLERARVRALQQHARRHALLVRFEPARRAQAPAVARIATAIAEKARLGLVVTALQRFAEYVDGGIHGRALGLTVCAERSAPAGAGPAAISLTGARRAQC